ncbi:TetR/AcrR family transcriptional regulator [Myceligenerans pegani]|uniref:TetR/AcrR family transcriptional regulator C-terminal domain-containing protein n=1 Tax=Myceligenerans pegani TaxID=2776917 RepID=A0ABR9N0M4_9MICO|nr:TetR/AcrR family transcriptional regulator [Myceligenerans sp. TRM 65318]MBE1876714.1 TetR/AcrR family transcriptional regulator C-terminal domain-containing protein [Myceligenerans sp. TRM 65318]MBE3018985.1 TetR/AcrR family transcriptional regulator C-terminal domain-containing protein [Myceligenerans sp. TRM 65318]
MSIDTTPEPAGQPQDPAEQPGDGGADGEPPATLQRLWGATAPRRRGPKPALSVERIVQAAMELADAEGLAAVSMARIAEAVGYTPMALYRHVAGKEELLVLMSDAVAADLPDIPTDVGWRAGLEAWTRAQIEMGLTRPWFLELPLSAAIPGPNRVRWLDQAFGFLREVDLPADEKLAVVGLLAQHVLGETRVHVESRRAAAQQVRREAGLPDGTPESELDPAALAAADPYADFEAMLGRFASPATYPHLFEAFAAWEGTTADAPSDDDIGFGIMIVLDGVEAYLRRRGALPADDSGDRS